MVESLRRIGNELSEWGLLSPLEGSWQVSASEEILNDMDSTGNGVLGGGPPRISTVPLPASGAWTETAGPDAREFVEVSGGRRFLLEGGGELPEVRMAYETWGEPERDGRGRVINGVLLCHALTMDAHAAGRNAAKGGSGGADVGWWDDLIGPGRPFDTDRYFVVCSNVLGGCQGTTGPSSVDPTTGTRYAGRFPVVSIRDMVRIQAALANQLDIDRWRSVVGGSMGGMQVLEWAVMFPERVASYMAIASCAAASAQHIAYNHVQRRAIVLDPAWRNGDYYDADPGCGPTEGLALARKLGQITYRSDEVFSDRFGRGMAQESDRFGYWDRFDVEGYLDYHGAKLCHRFDANTYLILTKAWDLHDLGRRRGGIDRALSRVTAPGLSVSIDSDALFYSDQQHLIRDTLRSHGTPCEHGVIQSPHGHDAFLIEHEQVGRLVRSFLDDLEDNRWNTNP